VLKGDAGASEESVPWILRRAAERRGEALSSIGHAVPSSPSSGAPTPDETGHEEAGHDRSSDDGSPAPAYYEQLRQDRRQLSAASKVRRMHAEKEADQWRTIQWWGIGLIPWTVALSDGPAHFFDLVHLVAIPIVFSPLYAWLIWARVARCKQTAKPIFFCRCDRHVPGE